MKTKSIYDLKLNETLEHFVEGDEHPHALAYSVIRVPGGWVYSSFDKGHNIGSSAFVPYNNEFEKRIPRFGNYNPNKIGNKGDPI